MTVTFYPCDYIVGNFLLLPYLAGCSPVFKFNMSVNVPTLLKWAGKLEPRCDLQSLLKLETAIIIVVVNFCTIDSLLFLIT